MQNAQKHSTSNGSVPTSLGRISSEAASSKKPPIRPSPYSSKSATLPKHQSDNLPNGALKEHVLSPIKKNDITYASTPELSVCSSKSDDSPEFNGNMKTSTPDTKRRRRVAPPPPPRPAAPKALFTEGKSDAHVGGGAALPVKTNLSSVASSTAPQVPAENDVKLKPSQKKRPAPPRPARPPPPQPAPRVAKQGSLESKDAEEAKREKDVNVQVKQDKEITRPDRESLSLDLERHRSDSQEEVEVDNLRGIPIFIPPPPPDELPPPLDECETPVGPLTDFEADILEGKDSENISKMRVIAAV